MIIKKRYDFLEIMKKFQNCKDKSEVWNLAFELREQYDLPIHSMPTKKFESTPIQVFRDFLFNTIQLILLDNSNKKTSINKEQQWIDLK